jgi:hypothetical protein
MRISMLSYKMPEKNSAEYGVFAKIPRHPPDYNKRWISISYFILKYHQTLRNDLQKWVWKEFQELESYRYKFLKK